MNIRQAIAHGLTQELQPPPGHTLTTTQLPTNPPQTTPNPVIYLHKTTTQPNPPPTTAIYLFQSHIYIMQTGNTGHHLNYEDPNLIDQIQQLLNNTSTP